MATPEHVKDLNDLFAEEIEAAIRYLHLAVTVKGLDRLLVQKVLLERRSYEVNKGETDAVYQEWLKLLVERAERMRIIIAPEIHSPEILSAFANNIAATAVLMPAVHSGPV